MLDQSQEFTNAESEIVDEELTIGGGEYKPFTSEPVNEKSYSKPPSGSDKSFNTPIEEPVIMAPPLSTPPPQQAPPKPPVNPQISQLPPKDKIAAAKVAANMALSGYKMVNQLANKAIQISPTKLEKEQKKGLIDLRIPLQLGTQQVSAAQYIDAYNMQSADVFTVTKEFEDEIMPPLERVFAARGIGASDMDMVLYCLGKDLAFKIPRFVQLLNNRKDMLSQLRELTEAYKGSISQQQYAEKSQYQAPNTPPPPMEYEAEPEEEYTPPPPPTNREPNFEIIPEPDDSGTMTDSTLGNASTIYEIKEKNPERSTKKEDKPKGESKKRRNKFNLNDNQNG